MTQEQLERGNYLDKKIKEFQQQIERWEQAKGIYEIRLSKDELRQHDNVGTVYAGWIDFKIIKILTLEALNKQLIEYQTEYNNL